MKKLTEHRFLGVRSINDKMSRPENKYGRRYGFPPLKGSKAAERQKRQRRKLIKKVKVTIPALGVEKIFNSLKECCETFGVDESRIYTYIRMGYAAKGIMLFKWEEE